MNKNIDIKGVGGFLAVLILCMTVLIPIFGIFDLINSFKDFGKNNSVDKLILTCGFLELLGIILNISAGFKLYKKFEKSSVAYAIKVIWFNYFFINLILVIYMSYFLNQRISHKALFDIFFYGILLSTILTIYFKRSKRIKNTYL